MKGSLKVFFEIIEGLENSFKKPIAKFECEPQMGKRNLYDNTSIKTSILKGDTKTNLDFLVYANGKNDLFDIANYLDVTVEEILLSFDILKKNKLINFKK